jgi:hypothetical protein
MRCLACGAEMELRERVQDETMPVPGFEHHTFCCAGCGDVERRLVFRPVGQGSREPVATDAAPSISPDTAAQSEVASEGGMARDQEMPSLM